LKALKWLKSSWQKARGISSFNFFVHDVFDSHVSWKMKNNKVKRFRLTIASKLLLGFLSCALLTILIGITAVSSLRQMDQINNRITERDIQGNSVTNFFTNLKMFQ